eukprot:2909014-Alexandrium_andersonii.AAC.1
MSTQCQRNRPYARRASSNACYEIRPFSLSCRSVGAAEARRNVLDSFSGVPVWLVLPNCSR